MVLAWAINERARLYALEHRSKGASDEETVGYYKGYLDSALMIYRSRGTRIAGEDSFKRYSSVDEMQKVD